MKELRFDITRKMWQWLQTLMNQKL